jgi:N utilization substance protein B
MLMRRSRAREVALQLLFQFDMNATVEAGAIEQFLLDRLREVEGRTFCRELYQGVVENRAAIDEMLTQVAENWRLARMASVDRNLLRLGSYELMFRPDVPVPVAINEAIELARRYGNQDSPTFINGVLDKVAQLAQVRKPDAASPPAQST